MQVPRTVGLGRPISTDELVGDVGQRGIFDNRGRVQHPTQGSPVAIAAATTRSAVWGSAMSPHSTWMSAPVARMRQRAIWAAASGAERDVSTIRPQPAAAILAARKRPRPPRPPVMR